MDSETISLLYTSNFDWLKKSKVADVRTSHRSKMKKFIYGFSQSLCGAVHKPTVNKFHWKFFKCLYSNITYPSFSVLSFPKPGIDYPNPLNFSRISLLIWISKAYECFFRRNNDICTQKNQISGNKYSFPGDHSTLLQLLWVNRNYKRWPTQAITHRSWIYPCIKCF